MNGAPAWFDPDDERTCRAVWSRLTEPGDIAAAALVRQVGPGLALAAVVAGRAEVAGHRVLPRWRVRLPDVRPDADLAALDRAGGRLVVPGDEQWPPGLDDLLAPPSCLWLRGPLDPVVATRPAAAVVGARACSPYGERVTPDLAAGIAEAGVTVVSGAAFGIDALAHRGALAVGGRTVAVVAGGVDRPYPKAHEGLLARIAAEGLVVSEAPPGAAPTRWRFVQRNRLIAALSQVTVVVEAARTSGALSTAGHAEDLNRIVAAVPGPVGSAVSAGTHLLLRRGAVCVTGAPDVLELVLPLGEAPPGLADPAPADDPGPGGRPDPDGELVAGYARLGEGDRLVLDAVPLRRAAEVTRIARVAGLELAPVSASLGRLQLLGLVLRVPDGWRRAPRGLRRPG